MPHSKEFAVHKLNDEGLAKAGVIANTFTNALKDIEGVVQGESREMSLVRTNMEIACFYAKKAMANNPQYQAK